MLALEYEVQVRFCAAGTPAHAEKSKERDPNPLSPDSALSSSVLSLSLARVLDVVVQR